MAQFLQQNREAFSQHLNLPSKTKPASLQPGDRKAVPLALYLFAAVLGLRLFALAQLAGSDLFLPATGDMRFYNAWALRILHGVWTDHLAFYGLPLYAYLLAAIYKLLGYVPFAPAFLQAVLDAGTAVLLYQIAQLIFRARDGDSSQENEGRRGVVIGLLAAMIWAFFQPAQSYAIILMPTSWLVFIFWFVVWQIIRRSEAPRLTIFFALGFLIGFSAMGIATALFLVPLIAAAIFFRWPGTKSRRAVGAALVLTGVFAGASPAWIHNCFVAHDPVFLSAHSGVNFWIGNNPRATGYPRFPPGLHAEQQAMLNDSIRIAEQANGHSLRRSEVSAYWSRQAVNWIEGHPWEWLNVLGAKIRNFWNAFQYDDLSVVTEFREARIILPGLKFGLIAGLALPGMLVAFGRWKTSRWVLAAILLHMTSLLTVFVTERYRLAAVPGLALFAGFTLWEIWQRATEMRVAGLAGLLSLIACSTVFVSIPQKDETLWSLDAYNSGLKALEAGRLDDAQRKLNLAYAYSPRNAGVNFAKGNLCYANHDIAGAKHFYQSTLRLDPQHPGAWNNLGVISLEQEHWTIAAECFARAIEGNQSAGKTFYLLAEAQYHAGNLLAADTAIIRALELNPDQSEFRSLAQRISIASNIPPLP